MAAVAGATVLQPGDLEPGGLAEAMLATLAAPRPAHAVRCDGAARAADFIARLAS
jgi:predicted glycosyltransferase